MPKFYEFTFHYGPIQMIVAIYMLPLEFVFTFHYGPIQIRCYCNPIVV